MRLTSQFNGIYYNKFDDRQPINNDRPFFMWLMGDKSFLNTILKKGGTKSNKRQRGAEYFYDF